MRVVGRRARERKSKVPFDAGTAAGGDGPRERTQPRWTITCSDVLNGAVMISPSIGYSWLT
jgi:hypothetical protein